MPLFALALAAAASTTVGPATVMLKTSDGVALTAYESGKGTNGVILVHDKGHSASDWQYLATKLSNNGYHVLTFDLRGCGASKLPGALTDADYPAMVKDVDAAIEYLHGKGATKLAVLGASFGADLAVTAAADEPAVTNLVLLSPGLNVNGVLTAPAMEKYGARPVLLVTSEEDSYGIKTVNTLEDRATGDKHVEVLENAGSGATMLNRDADLEGLVFSWLNGTYHLQNGEAATAHANVNTGDNSQIQTTGKKFGER